MHETAQKPPRIGVPWRTAAEQTAGKRRHYENYLHAVREAGGDPVEISLFLPDAELASLAESLDAIVLPGSPADIEPGRYGSVRHEKTADADMQRERTDSLLLNNAFAARKPVLGICYGTQLLNVHFGGSLVQDIPSELHTSVNHDCEELSSEPLHPVHIQPFDRGFLFEIAASIQPQRPDTAGEDAPGEEAVALVNTSHHQSILEPGAGLRITARAPDGVIEAIEWAPESPRDSPPGSSKDSIGDLAHARRWIVGVQWHPERMPGDALARALFRQLVSEAISARSR
jgi:putative glutamine amidotransferase